MLAGLERVGGRLKNWLAGTSPVEEVPKLLRAEKGVGPDFLIIGAQKGGTRWLYDQIDFHPDFWMPPIKELHYFNQAVRIGSLKWLRDNLAKDPAKTNRVRLQNESRPVDQRDLDFARTLLWLVDKPVDIEAYTKLFNPKGKLLSGDVTPTYSILPDEQIEMICRRFPSAKIVFIAREPVTRCWSRFAMIADEFTGGGEPDWPAVEKFLDTAGGRGHGRPTEVVARWRRHAGERNFGLFFFDELQSNPTNLRRSILSFIGADPDKPSGNLPVNFNRKSKDKKLVMPPEIRERLVELYADELKACAREFGGMALEWPKKYGVQ